MAKKIEIDLGLSQSNLEALQVLSSLWRELEVLPEGVHKEYVWDECFTILSSLMRTLLKTAPEAEINPIENLQIEKISRAL